MKLLFITLFDIRSIDSHDIYTDLMRKFAKDGHEVFIVSPIERRNKKPTSLIENTSSTDWHKNVHILKVKTGNIQKTNFIEKGISTVLLEGQIKKGIKKYFGNVPFDLVIYSTPPITLTKAIKYVKRKYNCKSYLLLKDIFPQNALDLGILSKGGLKGFLYRSFRKKEKQLYALSDRIGCMSPNNASYLLKHNPEINKDCVEVCPNSIEIQDFTMNDSEKQAMRNKYNIPLDKRVFVYGGNLGRPQGIEFIIKCLESRKDDNDNFFLIVGDGTEFTKLEEYKAKSNQSNFMLLRRLPKDDYDYMISSCDVGMIFLDYRFTIPNFPSRLLAYLQAKLPVLACVDENTDIGTICEEGGFGVKCISDNVDNFTKAIGKLCASDLSKMGKKGFEYLKDNYSTEASIKYIYDFVEKEAK